jgi:hypothetical protein
MSATVTQIGSAVRVRANPRGILSASVVNSELLITYTNGETESAGFVGSPEAIPDLALTSPVTGDLILSPVSGEQLVGYVDATPS